MAPSTNKIQIFVHRLGSTLVLWTIVLVALFAPNATVAQSAFLIIVCLLGTIAYREYTLMVFKASPPLLCYAATLAGLVLLAWEVASNWQIPPRLTDPAPPIAEAGAADVVHMTFISTSGLHLTLVPTVLFLWLALAKLKSLGTLSLTALSLTLFGWFYVFWLLLFIVRIYFSPGGSGTWLLLYFILVKKFSDLGAYLVGSLVGRHKMAPRISPGKTWEGFAGALATSLLISLLTVSLAGNELAMLRGGHAIILGLLMGGMAVAGDLVESLIKRETQTKDSGTIFPGIGGCLDLIDSLLFNAPIFYLYFRLAIVT